MSLTVERFEGDKAVLKADAASVELPRAELPEGAGVGSVLELTLKAAAGGKERRGMLNEEYLNTLLAK
uniref:Uncharacterized protein n=1 Tax=termite gut metagenome TaxID=433724 RepID=S0DDB1_9ZZZZ